MLLHEDYRNVDDFDELCTLISRQLLEGKLEWPLFVGYLGDGTNGGSDGKVYSALCSFGFLTINSQEGACSHDINTIADVKHKPNAASIIDLIKKNKAVAISGEEQFSYVEFLITQENLIKYESVLQNLRENGHAVHIGHMQNSLALTLNSFIKQDGSVVKDTYSTLEIGYEIGDMDILLRNEATSQALYNDIHANKVCGVLVASEQSCTAPISAGQALLNEITKFETPIFKAKNKSLYFL